MRRLVALLVALAVAVHLGALFHPFVFDDRVAVLDNPSIRDLRDLRWIVMGSRRVVTNFSYAVDWAVWGPRPFGFHLTNVVLHAANVLLLFALAKRLSADRWIAFVAAAIFAVHPLATETVGYVASRAGLLCTLFLLAGTLAFLRGFDRRVYWPAAFACWLLAAGAKETGLVMPALFLLCDLLFGPTPRRSRLLLLYLPLGVLAAALVLLRLASYHHLEGGFERPLALQLLTQVEVLWRYLFLFVVPIGLSVVHSVTPVARVLDPLAWLGVASLAVGVALVWTLPRTAKLGAAWLLLLLLPSSVVPLGQDMAEHRVYEALVGLALLAAIGLPRRKLVVAVVVIVLSALTLAREHVWRSSLSLWQDAVAKAPREWGARYALGDALRESGDCGGAVTSYRIALGLRDEPRARRNLAVCLTTLGELDQAAAELDYLVRRSPRSDSLQYDLGIVQAQRGRLDEARIHLQRAAELGNGDACAALERAGIATTEIGPCVKRR
jgi:protein O-mannosyl-transferase